MRLDPNAPDEGVYLGRDVLPGPMPGEKQRYYPDKLHQILFGQSGVGKGMRVLVPNLLHMTGRSLVVIDPKGQLAAMTAYRRHLMGNRVKIIDPFGLINQFVDWKPDVYGPLRDAGLAESVGFNPLASLDPTPSRYSTFFEDAAVIAEALVKIDGTSDPHWPMSARSLVLGLLMWERKHFGTAGNLEHVRQMLTEADKFDDLKDAAGELVVDADGNTFETQVAGLKFHADMMIKKGGFQIESLIARFGGKKWTDELDSIRSTADTQTMWMLSEPMRADLKKNGIDFSTLKTGDRPTTVYVVLPSKYLETHSVWLRLVVSEAIRANMVVGGREVMIMMDEFPALDYLDIVARMWGVARDYGVTFYAVLQDMHQLEQRYPKSWKSMLNSTGVVQSFRTDCDVTSKWFSDRSPPDTLVALGFNLNSGGGSEGASSGLTFNQIKKPFIEQHDMYGLKSEISIAYYNDELEPARFYMSHISKMRQSRELAFPNPYHAGFEFNPFLAEPPRGLSYSASAKASF